MATGSKKRKRRNPATRLTDDLIVEILSRLPVKSLCRFRCVFKHWRGLVSDHGHCKRLSQTLAGFFYHTTSRERFPESARHFTNVTGRGEPLIRPSLSFLPGYANIDILDCCNGRLLCCSRTVADASRYIVCNPATEQWVVLPTNQAEEICTARLGFDPAVFPHFHVFAFMETDENPEGYVFIEGLEIYSSLTGEWIHRDSGWSDDASLFNDMTTVFLNGILHVFESVQQDVLAVDTEGKVWRTIPVPLGNGDGFIGQSQGRLFYLNAVEDDLRLTIFFS